jgi:hypothetical protein
MGMTHREHIVRSIMITGVIIAGLLFWIGESPVEALSEPYIKLKINARSSGLGIGDPTLVQGARKGRTLAGPPDREVTPHRRFSADHPTIFRAAHLQRDPTVLAGVAVLYSGVQVQVGDIDVHLEKVSRSRNVSSVIRYADNLCCLGTPSSSSSRSSSCSWLCRRSLTCS